MSRFRTNEIRLDSIKIFNNNNNNNSFFFSEQTYLVQLVLVVFFYLENVCAYIWMVNTLECSSDHLCNLVLANMSPRLLGLSVENGGWFVLSRRRALAFAYTDGDKCPIKPLI